MGLAIDLEAATAEPYHAMRADDPSQAEAAACGRRRRSSACSSSVENEGVFMRLIWAVLPLTPLVVLCIVVMSFVPATYYEPSYSVDLTGYEGIDPGAAARIVSPSFNVTLRMKDTCVDSARVAVAYSGVALGWARAEPRDCAKGRWAKDVEVVARGGRVGLSRRLRDRMASDWRSGAVELDVSVMMYREEGFPVGRDIPRTFDGKVKMMNMMAITA